MEEKERSKAIVRTSYLGIAANALLVAMKMVVAAVSGSIAIFMDAVNNLSDALSSVITIAGVKLAHKPADKEHPMGYGRVEFLSALLISSIVLAAGISSLVESVKKIFSPVDVSYTTTTLSLIVVAVIVKIVLGLYTKKKGVQTDSDALVASGKDALFDSILSAGTLVSALIGIIWSVNVDAWVGAAISLVIIKAGLEMLREVVDEILGTRISTELSQNIKRDIRAIDGVLGAYDLFLETYGPNRMAGSVHVEIPNSMTADEIHALTRTVSRTIFEKYGIVLTCGIYSVPVKNDSQRNLYDCIRQTMKRQEGVIDVHAIRINEDKRLISMDVVKDFDVRDEKAWLEQLHRVMQQEFPGYKFAFTVDIYYSD